MVKAYATIKTRKKLSSASLRMDNSRAWGSCTLQAGIIISESSSSIRKMEEGFTSGQANNQIFTKANSWKVKETVGALSGGQMEAGMKDSSEMEFKVAMAFYIAKEATKSTKGLGIMECSTERAHNFSRTEKSTKARSKRTSSTAMEFSIRTTRLSMVCGKITNYRLSTWSNLHSLISDLNHI